ncbi:hypothetical protein RQP53_22725 [Paucibacter sp. APW11]|uniref:Uncharacterized protein n=1 Tax=Roseateles aquae TaxID=3077235 RepID=A0ABU3PHQ4_9BURK|nr:hypothetical protein [Paucibacter sp. APW11]MDT9002111.1 hypothetical protein [Paucibacter sp. APW11]
MQELTLVDFKRFLVTLQELAFALELRLRRHKADKAHRRCRGQLRKRDVSRVLLSDCRIDGTGMPTQEGAAQGATFCMQRRRFSLLALVALRLGRQYGETLGCTPGIAGENGSIGVQCAGKLRNQ